MAFRCNKGRIKIDEKGRIVITCFRSRKDVRLLSAGCPDCNNDQCIIKKIWR